MRCNIDSRGKLVRLIWGTIIASVGIVLTFVWALGSDSPLAWVICLGCLLAGAFMIFEGRSGWCALRAMGFKTRV